MWRNASRVASFQWAIPLGCGNIALGKPNHVKETPRSRLQTPMLSLSTPISDLGELADTSFRSLPPAGLLIVGAVLVSGLLMWAFGGRLVRPMYGFLFGVAGAAAGLFVPAMIGLDISPYVGIAVGAVGGVLAGLLLFRLSMATALGTTGGVLAPLIAAAVMWLGPAVADSAGTPLTGESMFLTGVPREDGSGPNAEPASDSSLDFALDTIFGTNGGAKSSDNETTDLEDEAVDAAVDAAAAIVRSAAERTRAFIAELAAEARAMWGNLPGDQRLVLGVAAVLGGLAGFLLGLSFPKRVAAVGSAFIGAGIWTPVGAKLLRDFSVPGAASLPDSARGWLALWLIIAAIGLALQWTVLKPKTDKSSRAE